MGGGLGRYGASVSISGGTVTASCEDAGGSRGAGIGVGAYGYDASVSISGGRIKASGPSVIDPAASITGGLFAPWSCADGKVYGIDPPPGVDRARQPDGR